MLGFIGIKWLSQKVPLKRVPESSRTVPINPTSFSQGYGNLQDWADVHARFSNLRSPVCIVLTFLPARDNLKTVWIWIKTVKTVGLIRIQTVCHSDGIPENSLEKIMTMVIMFTLYLLVTVCKLVVTRSGTSKWLCWVWSGSKMVWQSGIPEKFIRVTSIKGYDWSTII